LIAYRVARASSMHESRKWSPPSDLDDAISTFTTRADRLGDHLRFRIRQRNSGDTFGVERNIADTVSRLRLRVGRAEVGDVFAVQAATQQGTVLGTLLVRVVEVSPDPAKTIGNSKVDMATGWILEEFAGIELWGFCARRPIAGTSTWSQHSPWPQPDPGSNAADWHHDDFREMARLSEYLAEHAVPLAVEHDIFNGKMWVRGRGWQSYGGLNAHRDHVHLDHSPGRTGTPRASCP